jgi:carboxymethylenebutenolidase
MDPEKLITTNEGFSCSDGFSMPAYIARPESSKRLPALLFVFDIFGSTTEMRRVADDFAGGGYVVMMPDLFSRGSWFSCVRKLMADIKAGSGLSVQDLLDARAWLAGREYVDAAHTATIGFCMGGAFALILAKSGLFQVAAPFYGQAPAKLDGACPIVASYGGRDKPLLAEFEKVKQEVERLNIPNDLKLYPGAGHGFMSSAPNPVLEFLMSKLPVHAGYNPQAAADATARVLSFLKAHI